MTKVRGNVMVSKDESSRVAAPGPDVTQVWPERLPADAKFYPNSIETMQPIWIDLGDWSVDGKVARIVVEIVPANIGFLAEQIKRAKRHVKEFGGGAIRAFSACGAGTPDDWEGRENGESD